MHALACLLGYGADAVCPRVGLQTVAALADETLLLVLLRPSADLGGLLFDVRRYRGNIAALI